MKKEITSISQYLEIIRKLDKAYAKDGGLNNPVSSKFLYRGMAHKSWPLQPGIFVRSSEQGNDGGIIYEKTFFVNLEHNAQCQIPNSQLGGG